MCVASSFEVRKDASGYVWDYCFRYLLRRKYLGVSMLGDVSDGPFGPYTARLSIDTERDTLGQCRNFGAHTNARLSSS